MDRFDKLLETWNQAKSEPREIKPWVPPERPKVELTLHQKRVIVGYMLGGVSKGVFEGEDFWDGVADIDGLYPSYRQASEEFVEELRQRLLSELK